MLKCSKISVWNVFFRAEKVVQIKGCIICDLFKTVYQQIDVKTLIVQARNLAENLEKVYK